MITGKFWKALRERRLSKEIFPSGPPEGFDLEDKKFFQPVCTWLDSLTVHDVFPRPNPADGPREEYWPYYEQMLPIVLEMIQVRGIPDRYKGDIDEFLRLFVYGLECQFAPDEPIGFFIPAPDENGKYPKRFVSGYENDFRKKIVDVVTSEYEAVFKKLPPRSKVYLGAEDMKQSPFHQVLVPVYLYIFDVLPPSSNVADFPGSTPIPI